MKRGLKALAAAAAVAMALTGPQALAACGEFGGYPVFGCGDRAWFSPAPSGSGAVTGKFFQIGFGNGTLNTGLGSSGTGMSSATTFNGNDNGNFTVDLGDARTIIGNSLVPVGSLCLRSNNWGNAGIDGCCDNPRDAGQPFSDDNILNPEYDVSYSRNYSVLYPSTAWVQDYPMAVLLTESTGNHFALAAVATVARTAPTETDVRKGEYNFKDVSNGLANPITSAMNIVPWQAVPGNGTLVVDADYSNPFDLSSDRLVDLSWTGVTLYSDGSSRPSSNSTVASGAGVADMGSLIRYAVQTQTVPDGSMDPFPQLTESGWGTVATFFPPATGATDLVVPINTCIRINTMFGKAPTAGPSVPDCRVGMCGDLGYGVVSRPACIGGPLLADGVPQNLKAVRGKGSVTVDWTTDTELTVNRFDIGVVDKDGNVSFVKSVNCKQCANGSGDAYSVSLTMGEMRGGRAIEVKAVGPNAAKTTNIK